MTDATGAALLPCPFCGAGETRIDEKHLSPTMKGPGALITVEVRHWCDKNAGVVAGGLHFRGRDHASAIAAWNRRVQHDETVERCAKIADNLATIPPRCEYEGGFQNACKLIASHIRALRSKP